MQVLELCRELGVEVVVTEDEARKSSLPDGGELARIVPQLNEEQVDFCIALGGDGTILRAFNRFRGMDTPVLGINFGRMGFLAAFGPGHIGGDLKKVLEGNYHLLELCLIEARQGNETWRAINDVVIHKPDAGSVVRLAYSVGGVEVDSFQCDGLVAATPAGSTAYNLSNGGPLASLSLEAFILTAIAPHTLRFRPLALARDDLVVVENRSYAAGAGIFVDGREEGSVPPGGSIQLTLAPGKAHLVEAPGSDFFRAMREKFIEPAG